MTSRRSTTTPWSPTTNRGRKIDEFEDRFVALAYDALAQLIMLPTRSKRASFGDDRDALGDRNGLLLGAAAAPLQLPFPLV